MRQTTKTDEFSEKFQTAFDPTSFSENHVAIFFEKSYLKPCFGSVNHPLQQGQRQGKKGAVSKMILLFAKVRP